MSKKIQKTDISQLRAQCKQAIDNNIFRIWMNRYDFPELNRKQKRAIMKELFNTGTISCGKINHLDGPESLYFVPYMTQEWDLYYEPQVIRFMNLRGVPFISKNPEVVNESCAIGYANSGRNSIKTLVNYYIDRMVECELILHNNLLTAQVPFLVNISPDQKLRAQDLIDKILNYESVVFTDGDINAIQALLTGAPWIADKIRGIFYDYQSQLYTILGIDNTKMDSSDKQFQLTEELDSNIAEINSYKTDIDISIQEFLDDIEEAFGIIITKVDNLIESKSIYDNSEEEIKQPAKGDINND